MLLRQRHCLLALAAAVVAQAASGSGQADPLYDPYGLSLAVPDAAALQASAIAPDAAGCETYRSYFLIALRNLSRSLSALGPDASLPLRADWSVGAEHRRLLNRSLRESLRVEEVQELSSLLLKLFGNVSVAAGSRRPGELPSQLAPWLWAVLDWQSVAGGALLLLVCASACASIRSLPRPLAAVAGLLALGSLWSWVRLYKEATTKKQRDMMKSLDSACQPDHNISALESALLWIKHSFVMQPVKDRCQLQLEALAVDPLWDVSPVDAVADTLTRLVLSPLQHAAKQLNVSLRLLVADLPLWASTFVLLFVTVLTLVLLLLCFGYRLRVPLLLELGPNGRGDRVENDRLRRQLCQLQQQLRDLPQLQRRPLRERGLHRSVSLAGDASPMSPISPILPASPISPTGLRRERERRLRPSHSTSDISAADQSVGDL